MLVGLGNAVLKVNEGAPAVLNAEDGTTSTREIVHHHGGACILPVDADGSVTMVRQFRYAFGEEIWELPAGKLEAGEDPFEAAKRELGEECGLTADHFTDLGVVYPTVGYDSERIYIWAATGLQILEKKERGMLVSPLVRGSAEETLPRLQAENPRFAEAIPMTLEEVFIGAMEAVGYDCSNVLS